MRHNPIVKTIGDVLIPPIFLFALYVQFHGDFGPGGGFQAGVIFAVGIILHALIYGLEKTQRLIPPAVVNVFIASGLLLYAGVGFVSLFLGSNYLDYDVLAQDPLSGQHLGIYLVELGVGLTVAAVMVMVFYAFSGRGQR